MNFANEKMAKALDLPNRSYFPELKKVKPGLYNTLQAEYNDGFKTFFTNISAKIKKMLHTQIDVNKFIEECRREFKKREELEKEFEAKRCEMTIENIVAVSDDEPGRIVETKTDQEYVWSDDDNFPQSGVVNIWKQKYEALEHDFNILNQRYSSCKNALANQINVNKGLEREFKEFKLKCVCQKIEQMFKRSRVE
jgi:hypothetical protein